MYHQHQFVVIDHRIINIKVAQKCIIWFNFQAQMPMNQKFLTNLLKKLLTNLPLPILSFALPTASKASTYPQWKLKASRFCFCPTAIHWAKCKGKGIELIGEFERSVSSWLLRWNDGCNLLYMPCICVVMRPCPLSMSLCLFVHVRVRRGVNSK